MHKHSVMILGKIPPPYQGTAVWMEIISHSGLDKYFNIHLFNTNVHKDLSSYGHFSIRKIFRNIGLYIHFYREIRKKKPALIHIPVSQTTLGFLKDSLFIFIASLSGSKIVIMLHGGAFHIWMKNASVGTRKYASSILKKCRGVIVLGNNLKSMFSEYFREDQIYVVPNGIEFPNLIKKKNNNISLIYLGNLQSAKGIISILKAINLLKEKTQHVFEFTAVGNWTNKKTEMYCKNFVKQHDLPVSFPGPQYGTDKYQYLKNSDIFVFPPVAPEGHPFVILEAMAAGLPIISTDQGAIQESVIHELNGFIVDADKPSLMAKKIKYLIENPEIREKMGKEGRKIYEERFTEKHLERNLAKVYQIIMEQNS